MKRYLQRAREKLWESAPGERPRRSVRAGRYLFVLLRDLLEGPLTMRATSLVYTTLLSIVPLLALVFSVLKAFGARHALEPFLTQLLAPLGPQAGEVTQQVLGFIQNVKVGVLGMVGIALLLWSALSLIQKVESSFNFVWRVERPRPLIQRLGEYFAMLAVGPLVIFLAVGITASILNSSVVAFLAEYQPFGFLIFVIGRLLPYVLIIALFTLFYRYVPNARVTLRAAATGGIFAGALWQTGSLVFASFVAGATNYNAIYSSFAILIFLLIWIYVGWMILLLGCQLAFYVQHPEHLKPHRAPSLLGGRQIEYLALLAMATIGRRFIAGEPAYTQEELSLELGAEPEHVARIVEQLIFCGLLVESGRARTQLTPAVDLDSVPLAQLWTLARTGEGLPGADRPLARSARALIDEAEADFAARHGNLTIRGWLNSQERN
ncbi:MAG: YihY/virulence factor BrkB family protein [Solimonas sp.]